MLILINVIFLIVSLVEWKQGKETDERMNRQLAEYQDKTEHTAAE